MSTGNFSFALSLTTSSLSSSFENTHLTRINTFKAYWSLLSQLIFLWLVGSSGVEPPTSRLSGARSNHLSYEPICISLSLPLPLWLWWRWWDSNPWPPACRAGALPTELHPHITLWPALLYLALPQNWTTIKQVFLHSLVTKLLSSITILLRKEVIQPHLPIRLPCYDLTPIIEPTLGHFLLAVRTWTLGVPDFHGLTGGVYKARERIHRGMLIRDY